ncbi:EAL domain-containing protein [Comamonas sp. JC664]|uniref:EAL domain-containing protein n=1 Tax=Comamonas sp. JC664 TaxID=2801917 RepID=UPI00174C2D6B|nr:EAL domain-containing protein [Comamonas sp. JC664]MBL0693263.1 EAL domain-containing protein [Comamonas sp. JC664]GHG97693.1 signal transduction protein [Comamonas sp. KCTC 72670]
MSDTPARGCDRCQALPSPQEASGRLFLWSPVGHSQGRLLNCLREARHEVQVRAEARCVVVCVPQATLSPLVANVVAALSQEEARATRALFMVGEDEPGLPDYPRVGSLQRFVTRARAGWLVDLLAEQRLTTHFQPIVHAQDTGRIFAYEALMRGRERDGALVPPGRMMQTAREADLLFQLDLAARTTAIREAVKHGLNTHLFINFTPTAIYDASFCLRSTVEAIHAAGIPPERVVFEIIETDQTADAEHLRGIVDFYRRSGFQVALDDLGAGFSSLNLIHRLRPDIIKLDMELVRDVHLDPYKGSIVEKLLEIARTLGIRTVAEGIETHEELRWVRAHGVDFVQGYLISRPQSPPVASTPSFTD